MWILTDVYGDKVIWNEKYDSLNDAKMDLKAEFFCFTSDDNDIEYGVYCFKSDDEMSAWAKLNGKYRIWNITLVL